MQILQHTTVSGTGWRYRKIRIIYKKEITSDKHKSDTWFLEYNKHVILG